MKIKNIKSSLNSLKFRVSISLILVAIIPLIIYIFSNLASIKRSFTELEEKNVLAITEQAKNIFKDNSLELQKIAKDNCIWDETYEKIQTKDIKWFKENFSKWMPNNYNVDLLIIADRNKEIIDKYGITNDLAKGLFNDHIITNIFNGTYDKKLDQYPHGLKYYNGELYLLGICPILTNEYKGPCQGVFILGRKINPLLLSSLKKQYGYNIVISLEDKIISSNEKRLINCNLLNDSFCKNLVTSTDSNIFGCLNLEDISDRKIGHIFIIKSRNMFLSFNKLVLKYMYKTIIFSILIIILLSIFLRKKIVNPIKNLESQIKKMKNDTSLKVANIKGSNEISSLTSSFNQLVNNLHLQEKQNKNLKTLSITDGLTSLYNHRYFYDYCRKTISENCNSTTIIFCDIDKFKVINDAKGHIIGDMILKEVGTILKESLNEKGLVFRYGGEEFAIVLNNFSSEHAFKVAENLRLTISNSSLSEKYCDNFPITISIGLATYPTDALNLEDLIAKADKAMYYAKQNGRNRCYIYSSQIDKFITENSNEFIRQEMLIDSVYSLAEAIDAKDSYTGKHSEFVTKYTLLLADQLNLSEEDKHKLKIGSLLHDCGKIGIPDHIINKPDKLTDKEYNIIKEHASLGHNIVRHIVKDSEIISCIRNHHERWDGKGYPDGLSGTSIPYYARIICIADSYHAMTSNRAYRKALTKEEAIEQLIRNKGIQFDPELVEDFIYVLN